MSSEASEDPPPDAGPEAGSSPEDAAAPPSPARDPSPARTRRWPRRLGAATLLALTALAAGWLHPPTRHRLLLVLTVVERRLTSGSSEPPAEGQAGARWVHAAWLSDDLPPNGPTAARQACRTYKGVELDVTFSRDLVAYVSHDRDYARVSGKPGDLLRLHTSVEIDAERDTDGQPPLRLKTLLSEDPPDLLVIDVKTDHVQAAEKARVLREALGERRANTWVLSMSGPFLSALAREAPELLLGCEGYLPWGNWLAGFEVSSLDLGDITAERDASARARGLKRLYWTARTPEQLARLERWSPDALLFDVPRVPAPPGVRREDP